MTWIPPIVYVPVIIGAVVALATAFVTETRNPVVLALVFIVATIVVALLMGGGGFSG